MKEKNNKKGAVQNSTGKKCRTKKKKRNNENTKKALITKQVQPLLLQPRKIRTFSTSIT